VAKMLNKVVFDLDFGANNVLISEFCCNMALTFTDAFYGVVVACDLVIF
jgi:hypothetical protein